MKILPPCLILSALLSATPALAVGVLAEVRVIDRNTGQNLPIYRARGGWWVAGKPGHRYAISIANRVPGRLLAVTAVDGVNVISGETAAFDQTGYVFDQYQRYEITGWRKNAGEVAAFEFTALADAYATRTGRPANVGVVGVALFRERAPAPVAQAPLPLPPNVSLGAVAPEARPGASARLSDVGESAKLMSQPQLGTGHGAREPSEVVNTEFERASPTPDEVISLRYDSYEHLVAMGIIVPTAPSPRAFPGSGTYGYVPDPPR